MTSTGPLTFRFTTTAADVKEARRVLNPRNAAAATRRRPPSIWRGAFGWVLFVGLTLLIYLLIQSKLHQAIPGTANPPPAPLAVEPASPPAVVVVAKKTLDASLALFVFSAAALVVLGRRPLRVGEIVVTVGDEGIRFDRPVMREHLFWACFTSLAETDNLFVLRETKRRCRFLPKRAMSSEEVTALRDRLADKLLPPTAGSVSGGAA